jgi:hypothetical protein
MEASASGFCSRRKPLTEEEGVLMYDPVNGRFLQQDPTGFDAGDLNLYRYSHNASPILADPSGTTDGVTRHTYRRWGRTYTYTVEWYGFNLLERPELFDLIGDVRYAVGDVCDSLRTFSTDFGSLTPDMQARLRRWFLIPDPPGFVGNFYLSRIRAVFESVKDAIDNRGLPFMNRGGPEPDGHCAMSYPFPWRVNGAWYSKLIVLYPNFWSRSDRAKAGVIFHELTHLYAWTNDSLGYVDRDPSLARIDPRRPPGNHLDPVYWERQNEPTYTGDTTPTPDRLRSNADTYAGFLEDYYLEFLSDRNGG